MSGINETKEGEEEEWIWGSRFYLHSCNPFPVYFRDTL